MMKLKITRYKQKDKLACGPACLKMIFEYYGRKYSEEKILKAIGGTKKFGIYTTDLAIYAAKQGFKVVCFTYNLKLLDPTIAKLSKEKRIKKLQGLLKITSKKSDNETLSSTIKLLKSHVDWIFEYPTLNKIKDYLKEKLPVLVAVNWPSLKKEKGDITEGHFIIIHGFKKDKFYYLDPWDGKEHQTSGDHLIFALSNNVLDGSGYMVIIKNSR